MLKLLVKLVKGITVMVAGSFVTDRICDKLDVDGYSEDLADEMVEVIHNSSDIEQGQIDILKDRIETIITFAIKFGIGLIVTNVIGFYMDPKFSFKILV